MNFSSFKRPGIFSSPRKDEDSDMLHGEDTVTGEPHNRGSEVDTICVFLLWTIALLGRIMSLPGVFGAVIYGLLDGLSILILLGFLFRPFLQDQV
uniref:Uncharacterized protein n=1 Tax=Anabas testudineus TaxID=64144 RepID=A0A3Q1KAR3_ANATE